MYFWPDGNFSFLVSNHSRKAVRFTRHVVFVFFQFAELPKEIQDICNEPWSGSILGTLKKNNHVHAVPEESTTTVFSFADDIIAVCNKPMKKWDSQMMRHNAVQNGDSKQLLKDRRMELQVLENFAPFQKKILSMLSDF